MTDQELLAMLKANLEKRNSINDTYLEQLIAVAKAEIKREGINLPDNDYSADQANVIVMYAAYLYGMRRPAEGRTDTLNPQGMPYMLRYALNNMLFAQKMGGAS